MTDNIAENPGLLPYASNVGAPKIEVENISLWKGEKINKTNKFFQTRYNEIKEEYRKLIEEFEWNTLVYSSNFSFTPTKGEIYYLYQRENSELFLSLIEPQYWNQIFIGSFKLDSNDKWIKI
jgi:hypothetical protein